jgi:GAF domain-containing protein
MERHSDGADASDIQRELLLARETVARQAAEIERLRLQVSNNQVAEELRESLRLVATAGAISAPVTHAELLELIVGTAAQVINADAASLFLVDAAHQELVFEVALGQKADAAKPLRLPLGRGFAGLVAVTGEPIAASDVQDDPRHAADIARLIGYQPRSILCVPLISNDDVIGVLELLDKHGGASFGPSDITVLTLFANQAAVAIEQSQTQRGLAGLLTSLTKQSDNRGEPDAAHLQEFTAEIEGDPDFVATLELARLLREIAQSGDHERRLCQVLVRGLADYIRAQSLAKVGEIGSW